MYDGGVTALTLGGGASPTTEQTCASASFMLNLCGYSTVATRAVTAIRC